MKRGQSYMTSLLTVLVDTVPRTICRMVCAHWPAFSQPTKLSIDATVKPRVCTGSRSEMVALGEQTKLVDHKL